MQRLFSNTNDFITFRNTVSQTALPVFLDTFLSIKGNFEKIDRSSEKQINSSIKDAKKDILNKELRCIIFDAPEIIDIAIIKQFKDYDWLDRIPFKTLLVMPEKPIFQHTEIEDLGSQTRLVSSIFLHRETPERYYIAYLGYDFSRNGTFMQGGYITIDTAKENLNQITHLDNMLPSLDVVLFLLVQSSLQKATKDRRHCLEVNDKHKVIYKDYRNRRIGKTIFLDKALYLGSARQLKSSNYAKYKKLSRVDHAYEVMGHWRKLHNSEWTGHDQEGKNIKGFTWVSEHIRGEGDLLVKTRIVKESENG